LLQKLLLIFKRNIIRLCWL